MLPFTERAYAQRKYQNSDLALPDGIPKSAPVLANRIYSETLHELERAYGPGGVLRHVTNSCTPISRHTDFLYGCGTLNRPLSLVDLPEDSLAASRTAYSMNSTKRI